ncbi:MAG: peroxidase-related enzyme [Xanthomonadales bacterium]|nr:peroxidase-related enzyme [Xanthomonadales bacterium]
MSWINTISYAESSGELRQLYDKLKGPGDNVDNIMLAHSLRPHSMVGHMALYKNVLHHRGNTIPKWFLEAIGVYTSLLNRCAYCVEHHSAGLARLLRDSSRSEAIRSALENEDLPAAFDAAQVAALAHVAKLTRKPAEVEAGDIAALRAAGWDDGQILEINQVTSYFNYANRTVLGLGVSTEGDELGLSPSDSENPDNWSHR